MMAKQTKQPVARQRRTVKVDDRGALEYCRHTMEEHTCRVGTPHGPCGIVEKVYQRRGRVEGAYGCKVIMDSGIIRYCDIVDVYVF